METLATLIQTVTNTLSRLPGFVVPSTLLIATALVAIVQHWMAFKAIRRPFDTDNGFVGSILRRARRSPRLVTLLAAQAVFFPRMELAFGLQRILGRMILIRWTTILLTCHFFDRAIRRHCLDDKST